MKYRAFRYWAVAGTLALLSSAAFADLDGCVNSPENPTLLLALAAAGVAGVRHWRQRKG